MSNPQIFFVQAHDNTSIRTAKHEPDESPKAVLQVAHGFGECIEHYNELAGYFVEEGFAVVIHDQRGHGEMPGLSPKEKQKARGVTPGFTSLLQDIRTLRREVGAMYPGVPVFLLGHSMGGLVAACYMLEVSLEDFDMVILEAPWFRLYKPLTRTKMAVVRLVAKLSGKIAVSTNLDTNNISRVKGKAESLKTDDAYHNRISLRLFAEITDAGERAIANAGKITVPTLVLNACKDKIVSPTAVREFAAAAGENTLYIEYEDGFHNLHSDIIRGKVLEDMVGFFSTYRQTNKGKIF